MNDDYSSLLDLIKQLVVKQSKIKKEMSEVKRKLRIKKKKAKK